MCRAETSLSSEVYRWVLIGRNNQTLIGNDQPRIFHGSRGLDLHRRCAPQRRASVNAAHSSDELLRIEMNRVLQSCSHREPLTHTCQWPPLPGRRGSPSRAPGCRGALVTDHGPSRKGGNRIRQGYRIPKPAELAPNLRWATTARFPRFRFVSSSQRRLVNDSYRTTRPFDSI